MSDKIGTATGGKCLAIFLCPLLDGRPFPRRAPPLIVLWLFRWLIFRIMLGAGLIKIRGDPCWRDLTALDYHFETQPLPNPLSRWFHFLPRGLLRAGVVFNHLAELVAPWFVFGPRMMRRAAGGLIVLFQGTLIASGNLSFLNWLTIVPALACFDDAVWAKIVPRALARRAEEAIATARPCRPQEAVAYAVAGVVAFLSINPVAHMFSRQQIMNTSFEPLNLVNTYGAFGSVGQERLNVVFEGTDAEVPDNTAEWREYSFKGLPVDPAKMPPQVAPYQLRLDWQMWFAAMSSPSEYLGLSPDLEASSQRLKRAWPIRFESVPGSSSAPYSSGAVSILLRQAWKRTEQLVEAREAGTLAAAAFCG